MSWLVWLSNNGTDAIIGGIIQNNMLILGALGTVFMVWWGWYKRHAARTETKDDDDLVAAIKDVLDKKDNVE